ncbi:MAG: ornithine cyclodeaminase family protein [Gemmatimonadales bacterium]
MVNSGSVPCLLFARSAVERLLDLDTTIAAVETGFRMIGGGGAVKSGVLGLHLPGGGLHVKAAVFPGGESGRLYLAAKLNVNLPGNPEQRGLPTIQGVVVLFDAVSGRPLALMDSMAITVLRTAAATAVAAKYLASDRPGLSLTVIGCGAQAFAQVAAVHRVRPLGRVWAVDRDPAAARRLAGALGDRLAIPTDVAEDHREATRQSEFVVTCTPSTTPFLTAEDVQPGAFIAAVGADNERKSELAPALLAASVVVTDDRRQCALIGDLHHAMDAGVMTLDRVRADLAEIVAGTAIGRRGTNEVVVFDSTGLPFEDVVAAAAVYERGGLADATATIDFAG